MSHLRKVSIAADWQHPCRPVEDFVAKNLKVEAVGIDSAKGYLAGATAPTAIQDRYSGPQVSMNFQDEAEPVQSYELSYPGNFCRKLRVKTCLLPHMIGPSDPVSLARPGTAAYYRVTYDVCEADTGQLFDTCEVLVQPDYANISQHLAFAGLCVPACHPLMVYVPPLDIETGIGVITPIP